MRQLPIGTLTLLFTDIEGSTRLLQRLGNRYAELQSECRRLLRSAFQQWNGYEVDTQGDAFFVVFERATDAIVAAMSAQQALFNASWPDGVSVRIRMGMHTGEPQAVEEGYIGLDVHRAARIMSAAHGGQVILSQTTHDLIMSDLPEAVSLSDLGDYRLKDIAEPNRLFQLVIQGLPASFPPLSAVSSRRLLRNIPTAPASFVGREQEITTICNQLRRTEVRLLTLMGAAGVGKTRLALQVITKLTDLFVDNICFVALEQLRDTDGVISAIAKTLDIQEEKGSSLIEQVKNMLREQSVLLVLDNFEQVLSARLAIAALLAGCPNLKILITSRVILHLQAERLFEVSPLPLPTPEQETNSDTLLSCASIALFVQRVQAVLPDFQLTATNRVDIMEICQRLDGMPLAIELAAAHARHFSPATLLEHLARGMIVLQGKSQDVPERQRTLRGAIAWSYDLLEPDEQAVFRRLSVCTGGITLEAAEQICTAAGPVDGHISEVLETLVDKSMLQREQGGFKGDRFRLLQVLRQYGAECLSAAGEQVATQIAQADYYLSLTERIASLLVGAELIHWLDQLDREYTNVRVALEWMLDNTNPSTERAEQALRLCLALIKFWEIRGYIREGLAVLKRALLCDQSVSLTLKAKALHYAGFLALMQDDNAQAETFLHEGQILFRDSGDKPAMANILRLQGNLAMVKNNYKIARLLLEESLTIYQEYNELRTAASVREVLAQVAIAQGSYTKAFAFLEEDLALYKMLGDQHSTAYPLYQMARIFFLEQKNAVQAQELAEQSIAIFRAVGNRRLMAYSLNLLAQILSANQEYDRAENILEESLAILKAQGEHLGTAETHIILARIAANRGDYQTAQAHHHQSRELQQVTGDREIAALLLECYANGLAVQEEINKAVLLWGTAAATRLAIVAPMPPVYRADYRQALAIARQHLDDESFREIWLQGSKTPLEQVMEHQF